MTLVSYEKNQGLLRRRMARSKSMLTLKTGKSRPMGLLLIRPNHLTSQAAYPQKPMATPILPTQRGQPHEAHHYRPKFPRRLATRFQTRASLGRGMQEVGTSLLRMADSRRS